MPASGPIGSPATGAPNLVLLSAQLRGYSLALCFGTLALWAQGILVNPGWRTVAQFTTFLFLALLSEYNAAWLAAGSGVYLLLRWRDLPEGVGRRPTRVRLSLLLLAARYDLGKVTRDQLGVHGNQLPQFRFSRSRAELAVVSFVALVKPVAYLFGSSVSAGLGLILFAIAIVTLPWRAGAPFLVLFLGANAAALLPATI